MVRGICIVVSSSRMGMGTGNDGNSEHSLERNMPTVDHCGHESVEDSRSQRWPQEIEQAGELRYDGLSRQGETQKLRLLISPSEGLSETM